MKCSIRGAVSAAVAFSVLLPVAAWPGPAYLGSKGCKKCHIKQYKAWEETRMSQAFELLKPGVRAEVKKQAGLDPDKDYTGDKKCYPCHVTGYNKPGGYGSGPSEDGEVSAEEINERMAGVGCEMCHGPGGDYIADDRMSSKNREFKTADLIPYGFIPKPQEEQCLRCHNEGSPFYKEFNFEERREQGIHEHFDLKYEH